MAMDTSKIHLPKTVALTVVNKVKETSTIAALSPSTPQAPSTCPHACGTLTARRSMAALRCRLRAA